jgi:hypothetical protein
VFGIVVGVALLLAGFGFAILAIGGALRNRETAPGVRHEAPGRWARSAERALARRLAHNAPPT